MSFSKMAVFQKVAPQNLQPRLVSFPTSRRPSNIVAIFQKKRRRSKIVTSGSCFFSISATLNAPVQSVEKDVRISIMVNSCKGKMGQAIIKAATAAGLHIVPVSFGSQRDAGKTVQVEGKYIQIHGPSDRESTLASVYKKYPNLVVLDFTVPNAVNENAELYCKIGVPFVMGTTGGDRDLLYKTVQDSNVYAIISPQMGKQVLGFLAALQIMSDEFPGTFKGYTLEVVESHQRTKVDTSGTARSFIDCFEELGASFDGKVILKRLREEQLELGVPEEHLDGHGFHTYRLTSRDRTVSLEFRHNVHGRSFYAEGTVDAAIFLAKKVQSKADKKIYEMIDVLREGNMR